MPALCSFKPKLTSEGKNFVLSNENAALIRSLILARGREGCTLNQIKRDFLDQVGVDLRKEMNDGDLRRVIEKIDYVEQRESPKTLEIFYYSNHPEQQHLIKLISNQRTTSNRKRHFSKSPSPYKQNNSRRRIFYRSQQNELPSSSPKNCHCDDSIKSTTSVQSVKEKIIKPENQSNTTLKLDESQSILSDEVNPFLHGCQLLGDNFFYTLATTDLGYQKMISKQGFIECGTCTNGLTIKRATEKVENEIDAGKIIIVNIGSADILNDRLLIEIMEDMIYFLYVCQKKEITPILTTLAPLPTFSLGNRKSLLLNFNRFLNANPFGFPVIDLYKIFVLEDGRVDLHCFQPEPRSAHGTSKRILMWNKLGRKKVLQQLKEQMAIHIVNIFALCSATKLQQLKWQC